MSDPLPLPDTAQFTGMLCWTCTATHCEQLVTKDYDAISLDELNDELNDEHPHGLCDDCTDKCKRNWHEVDNS